MFSCKYFEIFKNIYFEEHLRTDAFKNRKLLELLELVKLLDWVPLHFG